MIRFEVFGRPIGVARLNGEWVAYHLGVEGKHRRASDVIIPEFVEDAQLTQFLEDLCHEWASPDRPLVRRLSE